MHFRTNIQLQKEHHLIDYNANLLLVGSCFSENIGNKLAYYKFQVSSNPFGILFNPIAIERLITNAVNNKVYNKEDIFKLNERWHCFDAHSDLSNINSAKLLQNLNTAIEFTQQKIKTATHIIITLGTAWVYRFIQNDTIVGNCHKVPQKKFLKEFLSVEEIIASLDNLTTLIKSENPNVSIIFTVSPIRHLKDGFIENSLSKSSLITAIHQIIDKRNKLYYFPSFEIMLDDLRDYRFYTKDMIHPNETAIEYIWEQFLKVWISEKTTSTMKEIESIQKGLAHKPFNENSEQHQQFLHSLQQKITTLQKEFNIHF